MNGLNSEQGVATKLSNPSEYMEGHQESAEPDTPTSVASSTRYRDLPTWAAKINEHKCHPIKLLQSFEQGLGDSELQKHKRDVNELAEWIKSQLQHILYEELDQNLKGCKTARHWKTQRSRHKPRRSARIRQRELKTGIYYGAHLASGDLARENVNIGLALKPHEGSRLTVEVLCLATQAHFSPGELLQQVP
ncbi:hypothetical protein PG984_012843 [Apiospora sp. TS-2023a]